MANVVVICGRLRKAPHNAALARLPPPLARRSTAIDLVKPQLAGFAKFIERHGGKS